MYGDRISLIKGFECEYSPEHMNDYIMFRHEYGYRLMGLGQHDVGPGHSIFMFSRNKPDIAVRYYADDVCAGLETGFFDFLAHPELLLYRYGGGFDAECETAFRQIFSCCEKLDIPLEINGSGYLEGRDYPSADALILSKDYKLKYMINMDAHDPQLLRKRFTSQVKSFADSLGIHVEPRYFG